MRIQPSHYVEVIFFAIFKQNTISILNPVFRRAWNAAGPWYSAIGSRFLFYLWKKSRRKQNVFQLADKRYSSFIKHFRYTIKVCFVVGRCSYRCGCVIEYPCEFDCFSVQKNWGKKFTECNQTWNYLVWGNELHCN